VTREAKLPLHAVGERVKCRRRMHKLAQTIAEADHFRVCERWKSKIIYEKWESSPWTASGDCGGTISPTSRNFAIKILDDDIGITGKV
jgi:hypothetical protein